jgi:mono/diheme cytochrome c family protein
MRLPFFLLLLTCIAAAPADRPTTDVFQSQIQPLLKRFCYECHGDGASAADLALDAFPTLADIRKATPTWAKVIRHARTQTMPPPDAERQPTQAEREALVDGLTRELYNLDPKNPDPGPMVVRRLNHAEYRNTVRDLTGVSFDPTHIFPQDDTGYGFDNIGDVLTLPPMLVEKYLAAADKILDQAIPTERPEPVQRRLTPADPPRTLTSKDEDSVSLPVTVQTPGEYSIRVQAYAQSTTRPAKLSLMIGDTVIQDVPVTANEQKPGWYEARVGVRPGKHTFHAAVRRLRGPGEDRTVVAGRVGVEQGGSVTVKDMIVEGPLKASIHRPDLKPGTKAGRHGDLVSLPESGSEAAVTVDVPRPGDYVIRTVACASYCGQGAARMELLVDGQPVRAFDVAAPANFQASPDAGKLKDGAERALPQIYEARTRLAAGRRKLSVRFVNDLYDAKNPHPNYRDRNLFVRYVELVDPSSPPSAGPMTEPMRELFVKHIGPRSTGGGAAVPHSATAARAILAEFAFRAWRRPPQRDEVDRLVGLYTLARKNDEAFEASVKHAMKGVLVSSSFLFRGEVMAPSSPGKNPTRLVGDYELASRLSYFLWSSMPDDELLDLAKRGAVRPNLNAQVRRMLASPKSKAFVENFAGQWLQFRNLDAAHPDDKKFAAYDDKLRDAMKRETQLFFESIVREDSSLMDVLTADYTFLNARLAKHYGIPDVSGDEFRKVSLAGTKRRGVLTQGSVLTLTSNPTRTSPVKRGKWVLESLLGTAPPPPPPDVPALDGEGQKLTGTNRQRLEQHRADPNCASCHAPMDPIGFGLENFDAIGAWREKEGGDPIDATSAFADGSKFTGPVELAELLAKTRRNDYFRAVTEAAMTFAMGRGVEPYDQPAVDAVVGNLQRNDARFSTLILGVVNSVPFQMRRGEAFSVPGAAAFGGIVKPAEGPAARLP